MYTHINIYITQSQLLTKRPAKKQFLLPVDNTKIRPRPPYVSLMQNFLTAFLTINHNDVLIHGFGQAYEATHFGC